MRLLAVPSVAEAMLKSLTILIGMIQRELRLATLEAIQISTISYH
jgi:hypothetical protein